MESVFIVDDQFLDALLLSFIRISTIKINKHNNYNFDFYELF